VELDGVHVTAWFDEEGGEEVAEVLRLKTTGAAGPPPPAPPGVPPGEQ
jgi:hypothetical protein